MFTTWIDVAAMEIDAEFTLPGRVFSVSRGGLTAVGTKGAAPATGWRLRL
jgi:hypothetical protein